MYLIEGDDPLTGYLRRTLADRGLLAPDGSPDACNGLAAGRLDPGGLADAWAGTGAGRLIWNALWAGKPVWVPREGLPAPGGPLALRLRDLLSWGLTPCPLGELADWVETGCRVSGVVCLRRVETLFHRGFRRLYAAPGTVITPLARDRAGELGVLLTGGQRHGFGPGGRVGMGDPEM